MSARGVEHTFAIGQGLVWVIGVALGLGALGCSAAPTEEPIAGIDTGVAERAIPVVPREPEVRVVLKRARCSLTSPSGKTGTWRIDTPFPGAPLAIRRTFCSYLWLPDGEGAAPEIDLLELTRDERQALDLATLHCDLGECEAVTLDTEEVTTRRAIGPLGGGGGCPACGTSLRAQSFFIYLHHPLHGERVALLRRSPFGTLEDLGTITVPAQQAFTVRFRADKIGVVADDAELDAAKLGSVCLAPIHGNDRPTICP